MRLFLGIDEWCMAITNIMIRKVNWLTGKNNFWCARVAAVLTFISFLICGLLLTHTREDLITLIATMFAYAFLVKMAFVSIASSEHEAESERMKSDVVKRTFFDIFFRMLALFQASTLSIATVRVVTLRIPGFQAMPWFAIGFWFLALSMYCQDAPQPPYKRSKVLELLHSFFTKQELALQSN